MAELRKAHLSKALAREIVVSRGHKMADSYILLTPHASDPVAGYLAKNNINFIDLAGNCHLALGPGYLAHVVGKRPRRSTSGDTSMRRSGYRVLFALLVKPELAAAPVRRLAQAAGISKSGAAEVLKRLEREKVIGRTTEGRQLILNPRLFDRWIIGYEDILRPSLVIGRYRSQESNPFRLEKQIEGILSKTPDWGWGGGAAAFRLTRHYRGEKTALHFDRPPKNINTQLKLLPDREGPVTILKSPGPLAFKGVQPQTVHPLLVYSELLAEGGEREGEAAAEIRDRYLSYVTEQR